MRYCFVLAAGRAGLGAFRAAAQGIAFIDQPFAGVAAVGADAYGSSVEGELSHRRLLQAGAEQQT